jgi:transcriptional regulator with PAS, ATPase and Fis domain
MGIQDIKLRFGIIGNSPLLEHAIDTAMQVAPTDITVLISGESGAGKESFPQIIHHLSPRKHGPYIAVNCGAIPEGTIDSELFGHEKGSFTGAHDARKGYFEVVNGGTIFLDEVAELPLLTQVRLLRVLETGEFIKVGSSKVQKTNVRVVAATNVNLPEAIRQGKFREDLYYRLSTVPVHVPSLRQRKDDIHLLFRKFAQDFAEKYKRPSILLEPGAQKLLSEYRWPGNVRQLKNITEQISILEKKRNIDAADLRKYIPEESGQLPVLVREDKVESEFTEREILYKVLIEMRKEINELKKVVGEMMHHENQVSYTENMAQMMKTIYPASENPEAIISVERQDHDEDVHEHEEIEEESLSIEQKEVELIKKALDKHKGKRKYAARELGISERTLYRKINEYDIR